jgi:hypothetical protein
MNFFGTKKVDPIEQAKEWKRNLAKESRKLDRDILNLQRAEKRAMKECKIYAKKVQIFRRKPVLTLPPSLPPLSLCRGRIMLQRSWRKKLSVIFDCGSDSR